MTIFGTLLAKVGGLLLANWQNRAAGVLGGGMSRLGFITMICCVASVKGV